MQQGERKPETVQEAEVLGCQLLLRTTHSQTIETIRSPAANSHSKEQDSAASELKAACSRCQSKGSPSEIRRTSVPEEQQAAGTQERLQQLVVQNADFHTHKTSADAQAATSRHSKQALEPHAAAAGAIQSCAQASTLCSTVDSVQTNITALLREILHVRKEREAAEEAGQMTPRAAVASQTQLKCLEEELTQAQAQLKELRVNVQESNASSSKVPTEPIGHDCGDTCMQEPSTLKVMACNWCCDHIVPCKFILCLMCCNPACMCILTFFIAEDNDKEPENLSCFVFAGQCGEPLRRCRGHCDMHSRRRSRQRASSTAGLHAPCKPREQPPAQTASQRRSGAMR